MSATWHKCFLCEVEYFAEGDGRWGYCPSCAKVDKDPLKTSSSNLKTENQQEKKP